MADVAAAVTNTVTKAPAAFWDVAKKYWIFALLLLLVIAVAVMRWRATIEAKMKKAPAFMQSLARVSAFLLPLGAVLLGADSAFAACCAETTAPTGLLAQIGGTLAHWWEVLGAAVAGAPFLAISMFSAPDVIDGVTENGGKSLSVTPGTSKQLGSMFIRCPTKNTTRTGAPLVAVDTTVALTTTVSNLATGTAAIEDDDLARLLDYLEIESPTIGTVLDQGSGTGPVLNLVIEFLGLGFNRAVAPLASVAVGSGSTNAVAVTKYFTYPWCQRFMANPVATCPWLGIIDETELKMNWALAAILDGVSTGATYGSTTTVRTGTSYLAHPYWFQPLIAKYFVDKPASGSDGLTFKAFGGANPAHTDPIDYVHTIGQLSNLKGLPGNLLLSTITKIVAPSFGLDDVSHVDLLVNERLKAQISGRTPDIAYTNGGNHSIGSTANKMSMASLLFLLLRQPSLDMQIPNMLKFDNKTRLPIREEFSSTRSGADAFLIGSLRNLDGDTQLAVKQLSGGKMPVGNQPPRHFAQR